MQNETTPRPRRYLITGATGNLGGHMLRHFLPMCGPQDQIRVVVRKSRRVRKFLKSAIARDPRIEAVDGDLTAVADWTRWLEDVDTVVPMAAVIPPQTEKNADAAYKINVESIRALHQAISDLDSSGDARLPHVVFTSSVVVYGSGLGRSNPSHVLDSLSPIDLYGQHKHEAESIIQGLPDWTILRIGASPAIELSSFDPIIYEIGLDNKIEFVHPSDAGLAIARAADAGGKLNQTIHNIGGGPSCQSDYHDFFRRSLEATGVGMLPTAAFSDKPFSTSWMDTSEAQQVLDYQHHSLSDWLEQMRRQMAWRYPIVRVLAPLIRWVLAGRSPYYRQQL